MKISLLRDGLRLAVEDVLRLWREPAFQRFFADLLADVPFQAFFWEMRPIARSGLRDPFECVVIRADRLDRLRADPRPFAGHFAPTEDGESVVTFPNLGGDSLLVVPCPRGPAEIYAHLGAFTRGAPERQRCELWSHVAAAVEERLGAAPTWLSTAGLGVAWLHVRVDRRPKYYRYQPYRALARR